MQNNFGGEFHLLDFVKCLIALPAQQQMPASKLVQKLLNPTWRDITTLVMSIILKLDIVPIQKSWGIKK